MLAQARHDPCVAILLCTYNGQRFLPAQLESFAAQTLSEWQLHVSDDGSQDGTHAILKKCQDQWGSGRLFIHAGPAKGFVANFLSLVCKAGVDAKYYAYADQDDIWESDKIERAVQWLESIPAEIPALYCGRTCLVDQDNKELGWSPLFSKSPSFANALMQNIASGNTMVFNKAARTLLTLGGESLQVVAHDWWTYLLITGCGGLVFYDKVPCLRYRQHGGNQIGMNVTWRALLKRVSLLWQGRLRKWNDCNILALRQLESQLTPENHETLERFSQARDEGLIRRLVQLWRIGIYRQTILGNLGIAVAAIFRKM